jgi:ankyrin repeat protein
LPETLDATYERILQEIPKSNQVHAHRLLQCLTVAVRPLCVEELAEILAVDFNTSEGIPKLNEALRWEDQEQAVLSACSSLIAVIEDENKYSRVVQFSHFSVKEFLTSDRLAASKMDTSCYHHIPLEPAHTVMAQACLSVLLRLDPHIDRATTEDFPLVEYASEHFGDHAEFETVLSHIWDGVARLLDTDRSHFSVWVRIRPLHYLPGWSSQPHQDVIPLYYVASRGYRGLVDYLISKRPDDVNVRGEYGTPLHAALDQAHADVAQLLLGYCVDVDGRDYHNRTPLNLAADHGFLSITRSLVERNADINARDSSGNTPLHRTVFLWRTQSERARDCHLDVAKFLLEQGADPDAESGPYGTPLHDASRFGSVKGAQLMLEHGANIHARNTKGHTPLHQVLVDLDSRFGTLDLDLDLDLYLNTIRFLLAHGADIDALDNDHATPLHLASHYGSTKGARLLLDLGANVHLEDKKGRTPFQVAADGGYEEITQLLSEYLRSQQKM